MKKKYYETYNHENKLSAIEEAHLTRLCFATEKAVWIMFLFLNDYFLHYALMFSSHVLSAILLIFPLKLIKVQ